MDQSTWTSVAFPMYGTLKKVIRQAAEPPARDFASIMFTVSYFFVWGFVAFALLHLLIEVVGPAMYDTKPWGKTKEARNASANPTGAEPHLIDLTSKVTAAVDKPAFEQT